MDHMKRYVPPQVQALLPERVIDCIWKLALADECRNADVQTFTIVPSETNSNMVNIAHSYRRPNLRRWHRLHHASAEACVIRIYHTAGGYEMALLPQSAESALWHGAKQNVALYMAVPQERVQEAI